MVKIIHMEQGTGESCPNYTLADVYVKDRAEAEQVDTSLLIQGSKLLVIETAELFILNEDGGTWRSALDGSPMA